MKVKSKAELRQEIAYLQAQQIKAANDAERVQREQWEIRIGAASAELHRQLKAIYGGLVCNVQFEHVDASGYWYTYQLSNDARRQTYAIRHNDIA